MRAPYDRLHPGHSRIAYRYPGVYFVTIITHLRKPLLGRRAGHTVSLSRLGKIVARCWEAIPVRFPHVRLDRFVVMSDHVHGILILHTPVSSSLRSPGMGPGLPESSTGLEPGSLAAIVGSFKSTAAREINRVRGTPGARVWQRNFHENVLPDRESVRRVRCYIRMNPSRQESRVEGARAPRSAGGGEIASGCQHRQAKNPPVHERPEIPHVSRDQVGGSRGDRSRQDRPILFPELNVLSKR